MYPGIVEPCLHRHEPAFFLVGVAQHLQLFGLERAVSSVTVLFVSVVSWDMGRTFLRLRHLHEAR